MRIIVRPFFHPLFLVLVTLCVYYPVIFSPLCILDDVGLINALLNSQHGGILDYLNPVGGSHYYRPLLMLSFLADKLFWGLEESFMHLGNLLMHTANVLLVFYSCRELVRQRGEGEQWMPLFSGLLFALHPINTESVAWISGRSDLLACFFVLISFWTFLIGQRTGRLSFVLLGSFSFFLGCASKETALFFLPGIVFFLFGMSDVSCVALRSVRWRIHVFAAYVFSACMYLIFRLQIFRADRGLERLAEMSRAADPSAGFDLSTVGNLAFILIKTCGFYATKLLWPLPLNFAIVRIEDNYIYPGLLLFVVLCWLLFRRSSVACLILTAFSVGISSLLVLFSQIAWTPFAERYLYLPCTFFCMAAVLLLRLQRKETKTIALAVLSALCFGAAYMTFDRCVLWQDNVALFADTVEKSPNSAAVKGQYAYALFDAGREEEAIEIFREISPQNPQLVAINRAMALSWEGDLENSRNVLISILEDPGVFETHILNNIIKLSDMMADKVKTENQKNVLYQETLPWLERLYDLTGAPFFLYRRGIVYMKLGEKTKASDNFEQAFFEFQEDSIYKKPALKLAERLKNEAG